MSNDPYRVVETKKYRRRKKEYEDQIALYASLIPREVSVEPIDDDGHTGLHEMVERMTRGR